MDKPDFGSILSELSAAREASERLEAERLGVTVDELYAERERREEARRVELERREHERARQQRILTLRAYDAGLTPEDLELIVAGEARRTTARTHIEGWLADERAPRVLVLCGGVGVGKSFAAACACLQAGGSWVKAPGLPQAIAPWRGEEALQRSLSGRFVVLDDLGTEPDANGTRWAEAFGAFIDLRVAGGQTLITTNLPRAEIRGRYGDRIADRLNHVARAVQISGPSLRRQGGGF